MQPGPCKAHLRSLSPACRGKALLAVHLLALLATCCAETLAGQQAHAEASEQHTLLPPEHTHLSYAITAAVITGIVMVLAAASARMASPARAMPQGVHAPHHAWWSRWCCAAVGGVVRPLVCQDVPVPEQQLVLRTLPFSKLSMFVNMMILLVWSAVTIPRAACSSSITHGHPALAAACLLAVPVDIFTLYCLYRIRCFERRRAAGAATARDEAELVGTVRACHVTFALLLSMYLLLGSSVLEHVVHATTLTLPMVLSPSPLTPTNIMYHGLFRGVAEQMPLSWRTRLSALQCACMYNVYRRAFVVHGVPRLPLARALLMYVIQVACTALYNRLVLGRSLSQDHMSTQAAAAAAGSASANASAALRSSKRDKAAVGGDSLVPSTRWDDAQGSLHGSEEGLLASAPAAPAVTAAGCNIALTGDAERRSTADAAGATEPASLAAAAGAATPSIALPGVDLGMQRPPVQQAAHPAAAGPMLSAPPSMQQAHGSSALQTVARLAAMATKPIRYRTRHRVTMAVKLVSEHFDSSKHERLLQTMQGCPLPPLLMQQPEPSAALAEAAAAHGAAAALDDTATIPQWFLVNATARPGCIELQMVLQELRRTQHPVQAVAGGQHAAESAAPADAAALSVCGPELQPPSQQHRDDGGDLPGEHDHRQRICNAVLSALQVLQRTGVFDPYIEPLVSLLVHCSGGGSGLCARPHRAMPEVIQARWQPDAQRWVAVPAALEASSVQSSHGAGAGMGNAGSMATNTNAGLQLWLVDRIAMADAKEPGAAAADAASSVTFAAKGADGAGKLAAGDEKGMHGVMAACVGSSGKSADGRCRLQLQCLGVPDAQQLSALLVISCGGHILPHRVVSCTWHGNDIAQPEGASSSSSIAGRTVAGMAVEGDGNDDGGLGSGDAYDDKRGSMTTCMAACVEVHEVPRRALLTVQLWRAEQVIMPNTGVSAGSGATRPEQQQQQQPQQLVVTAPCEALVLDDEALVADVRKLIQAVSTADTIAAAEPQGHTLQPCHQQQQQQQSAMPRPTDETDAQVNALLQDIAASLAPTRTQVPAELPPAMLLVICCCTGCNTLLRQLLSAVVPGGGGCGAGAAPSAAALTSKIMQATSYIEHPPSSAPPSPATSMPDTTDTLKTPHEHMHAAVADACVDMFGPGYALGLLHLAAVFGNHEVIRVVAQWEHSWRCSMRTLQGAVPEQAATLHRTSPRAAHSAWAECAAVKRITDEADLSHLSPLQLAAMRQDGGQLALWLLTHTHELHLPHVTLTLRALASVLGWRCVAGLAPRALMAWATRGAGSAVLTAQRALGPLVRRSVTVPERQMVVKSLRINVLTMWFNMFIVTIWAFHSVPRIVEEIQIQHGRPVMAAACLAVLLDIFTLYCLYRIRCAERCPVAAGALTAQDEAAVVGAVRAYHVAFTLLTSAYYLLGSTVLEHVAHTPTLLLPIVHGAVPIDVLHHAVFRALSEKMPLSWRAPLATIQCACFYVLFARMRELHGAPAYPLMRAVAIFTVLMVGTALSAQQSAAAGVRRSRRA